MATDVVGEVMSRITAVERNAEAITPVEPQTFAGAESVQAEFDALVEQTRATTDELTTEVAALARAVDFIHQTLAEADQGLAASWDVGSFEAGIEVSP